MQKLFIIIAAISGALAVGLGAFGAHALKDFLERSQRTAVFETAVRYQFYHTLALLLVGILLFNVQHKMMGWAGYAFIVGIILFSGSLYTLCATNIKMLGAITPLGGAAFIAGWIFLLIGISKSI